jgi:DNA-directed RNA polymerase III subunit RPC11
VAISFIVSWFSRITQSCASIRCRPTEKDVAVAHHSSSSSSIPSTPHPHPHPTPPSPSSIHTVTFLGSHHSYTCKTCPYYYDIDRKISTSITLKKKEVDDVLGEDSWKSGAKTEAICPKCGHNEAFYMEVQIRSADEPATVFYKCTKCGKRWNEN